jgi:hypothetical protein
LILAYLPAGVVIGPEIGFAWVKDEETIELIARAVQNENELKEYRNDEFRLLKRREEVLQ